MFAALLLCGVSGGCASLTNPVAEGLPVRRLPPELLGVRPTGKTAVAERINGALPGAICIPYAVEIDGQIIRVFDAHCHQPAFPDEVPAEYDRRWILIRRPLVFVGGVFTSLAMMPPVLRELSMLNPMFHMIDASDGVIVQVGANDQAAPYNEAAQERKR